MILALIFICSIDHPEHLNNIGLGAIAPNRIPGTVQEEDDLPPRGAFRS